MKKIKYTLMLLFLIVFSIINVNAFSYYECNEYVVTKGNYIETVNRSFFNEIYRDELLKCPESSYSTANFPEQGKCYVKNGSQYEIYAVTYTTKTSYKPDNANTAGDINCQNGKKNIYSCQAATNKELCSLMSSECSWKNNSCDAKSSTNNNQNGDKNGSSSPKTGQEDIIEPKVETSCTGIFGGFEEDIKEALKAIRIIAPIIVGAFSVYEYLVAVIKSDADELKKCNSRLIKRLILMAILFLLPTLVNLLLDLLGDKYGTCL